VQSSDEDEEFSDAAWGSEVGFGNLAKGSSSFTVPDLPDVNSEKLHVFNYMG
jgi:20S proteasome subunit beta 5